MNAEWVLGLMMLSGLALGGCSEADDAYPARETLSSCDAGRPTIFHVARDIEGAAQAVADEEDGYLLFRRGTFVAGVVRVDRDGDIVEELPNPSASIPFIQDAQSLADGQTILTGRLETFTTPPTTPGWVGKVNRQWDLQWETFVGPPRAQHVLARALPDGGAIVAGTTWEDQTADEATNGDRDDAFVARIGPEGQIVWDNRTRFAGSVPGDNWRPPQTLILGADDRVRFIVQSEAGLLVLSSDLDGQEQLEQVLDTRLALGLIGVVTLPDGRLAIASNRNAAVLTIVDSEGQLLWEKTYDRDENVRVEGIVYNATRGELVLSGSSRDSGQSSMRTWMMAIDLDGEQTWRLEKEPMARAPRQDGDYVTVEPGRGPPLLGLSALQDGSVLALGASQMHLCYFTVAPGVCHE
jgi:hypothetical protein